jgi:toxin ParE1/3/4
MSLRYRISELAKLDLEGVWEYTSRKSSEGQADKYFELLIEGIETICFHPEIGRSIAEVKDAYRIHKTGSHLIIYKQKNDEIFIDRILHERMNIEEHL